MMNPLTIDLPPAGSTDFLHPSRQFSSESNAGSVGNSRHSHSSSTTLSGDDYETVDDRTVEFPSFSNAHHLGHGSYGTVVEVRFQGQQAALKMLAPNVSHKAVSKEAKLLHSLEHKNIIKLYAVYKSGNKTGLLLELMAGGSLHQLLHNHRQVRYYADHAMGWALQCADALTYLHGQGCLHRDLKPSNMLLSDNFIDLKLCDFGAAAELKTTMTNNRGSAAYMAPEVFQYSKYDQKCDVYSFGISFWEILARKLPVDDGEPYRVLWQATMENRRPEKIKKIPEPLMELIERCWHKDPNVRPDAEELKDIIEILSESCGNRFKPLIDLTTNRQAFASKLNEPLPMNYSAPEGLDEFGSGPPKKKPSAPLEDLGSRSEGPPPVPPRPTMPGHRRTNSGAYPSTTPTPDSGFVPPFTPSSHYTLTPGAPPYPVGPNQMPGSPGIGFNFGGAPPTPYTPPYHGQAPVYPTSMQAPPPICPSIPSSTGEYGFRRTSEPQNCPPNMGNGYSDDSSSSGSQSKRSKHKFSFLQKLRYS